MEMKLANSLPIRPRSFIPKTMQFLLLLNKALCHNHAIKIKIFISLVILQNQLKIFFQVQMLKR